VSKRRSGLGRGLAELLGEGAPAADSEGTHGPSTRRKIAGTMSDATVSVEKPEKESSGRRTAGLRAKTATTRAPSTSGTPAPSRPGTVELPVTMVRPNPRQPRRAIEEEQLAELARSIESVGLIQPVIVRPLGDGYELIAGERRWRAAQMAGYTVIPAILREASDVESLELALVENVVRQDLNSVDEAFAFQVLLEDLGVTQEALAAKVGKSRSAIANKIRLLELAAPVQEMLIDGSLSEGHGRALLGLRSRGDQVRLARKAVRSGLSVRAVESEVRRAATAADATTEISKDTQPRLPEDLLDDVRDGFYGRLEVVPRVRFGLSGGVIELPFKDEEDLRRLAARLGGS